jgi:hypothetical protein
MAYLRHTVLTRGPVAPATIAVITRGVPDSARAPVEAELRELFPDAAWDAPESSDLVVLVARGDAMESVARETSAFAPGATIWCYPVESGRVQVITCKSMKSWQRQQQWTDRLESWGRRHRVRWSLLGDFGRLVDRTFR